MKKVNRILSFLLVALLALCLAACALGGEEETKPVVYVPATQPDWSDETTGPVYTRPGEDAEDEDITLENPNGSENTDTDSGDSESNSNSNSDSDSDSDTGATGTTDTDTDSGDTFTDGTVNSNPQGSAKELSWSNINSFSIKSSSMSVAQMRKLCVDFFRYAKTALWTPDESISYIYNAKGSGDSMTGGTLYGGLPYVGISNGNIYRLLDYMGTDGKVDMSDMLGSTDGQLEMSKLKYFGNQCANGAHVGWGRVINSISKFNTARMTKANGYIPLGSYTYDTANIATWKDVDGYRTTDVVRDNGEQVMFASYALLQPADGLVYYTTAGHVIMVATAAHVEYVPGTDNIDGNKSYITIIDQAQKWETYTNTDGRTYQVKSSVDAKVTFQQLFKSNYLPFTFGEFTGADPVEATTCSFSLSAGTITASDLFGATVTANYGITDAYAIVTDASGNEVYKHAVRNTSAWSKTLKLAQSGANVDFWGTLSSGTYTVKVVVQLATGERPTVYTGQLTVNS